MDCSCDMCCGVVSNEGEQWSIGRGAFSENRKYWVYSEEMLDEFVA